MKYKMIALIGEAGSGKDTLLNEIVLKVPSINKIISTTTRPPRENEKNGIDYFYISGEEFGEKVLNNEMLEASYFNDWFYGTELNALSKDKVNIGVFNPEGIDSMMAMRDKIDLYVYYIAASPKQRLLRQLNREENPDVEEIIRRYKADKNDFFDLDFHYNEIPNNNRQDLKNNIKIIGAAARALQAKINQEKYLNS